MDEKPKARGERATFDRKTGEVHGSGSGAGGGAPGEDYDDDPAAGGAADPGGASRSSGAPGMSGQGHPLPGSGEARHGEIPEHLEREKGRGDDPGKVIQPGAEAVNPDGETYPYQDIERGPPTGERTDEGQDEDDPARGRAAHEDRGQSAAESAAGSR